MYGAERGKRWKVEEYFYSDLTYRYSSSYRKALRQGGKN